MKADIILQYIKAFLTWPVVTLIIAFMFRSAISNFLRRLVKGEGPGGWKLEAATPSEQRREIRDIPQPKSETESEKYIRENPKAAIKEYIRTFNAYWFERAYNLIYGTQIALLEYLQTKGDRGDKYINLVTFYNDFLRRSRFTGTQMADYLGFLKDTQFIEYAGEDTDITVKITPYGVDFLSYIKIQYRISYKYRVF